MKEKKVWRPKNLKSFITNFVHISQDVNVEHIFKLYFHPTHICFHLYNVHMAFTTLI